MKKDEKRGRKPFARETKIEAVGLAKRYGYAIAAHLTGVSAKSVHNWQRELEEEPKEPTAKTGDSYKYAESYRRKIADFWKRNGNVAKTAKRYGVDPDTVERCVRDFCPQSTKKEESLSLFDATKSVASPSDKSAKESATIVVETLTAKIAELLKTQNEHFAKIARTLNDANYRLDRILEHLSDDVEIEEGEDDEAEEDD